jgi:hypothetical protein
MNRALANPEQQVTARFAMVVLRYSSGGRAQSKGRLVSP